ncbi:MAG: DUF362 domain-containing protein [Oscillospiraceae bacterium]|nr:DUF362 domain-containing protein [Oscillospiraceae bacterium]
MVSVKHTFSYDPAEMDNAVESHFSLLRLDELLRPGMKVTVKPNLLLKRRPEEGTTTHPELVAAIIRRLRKAGVTDITVADSPGGPYTVSQLTGIYRASGMEKAAEENGAVLNFNVGSTETPSRNGVISPSFPIITPIAEADLVISVCKLKSHCMAGLSGGVKNLFGCIPGLTKPDYHWRYPKEEDFCSMLVDLCETVRPAITFCDAVMSMEGDGPSGGDLRQTNMTLCSLSPYELDLALCRVIGREEDDILTIRAAKERSICRETFAEPELCGDELLLYPDFKRPRTASLDFVSSVPAFLRPVVRPIVRTFLTTRPHIDRKKCIGCGKCAESCPAHTIRIEKGKARIDRAACIRCYCCHEMCPIRAIEVKQNPLLRL